MVDPLSSLFKMMASLLLVLGIILLCAYGARRFLHTRNSHWKGKPPVRVLATTYLGPKKEISVIQVGEEYLVVGVTPNHISLLTRLKNAPFQPAHSPETEDLGTT